jgi:predicted PurR-regulated permease PerM
VSTGEAASAAGSASAGGPASAAGSVSAAGSASNAGSKGNAAPAPPEFRDRAVGIVATGTILAVLYFARDVLVPITLAVILSLLIAPVVRRLRRAGFGATSSVLVAVLALSLTCTAVAVVIGVQVARLAQSLPQYEETIRHKLTSLNKLTVDPFTAFTSQTERLVGERGDGFARGGHQEREAEEAAAVPTAPTPASAPAPASVSASAAPARSARPVTVPAPAASSVETLRQEGPIPVIVRQPQLSPLEVVQRVLGSVWVPLETAGIVLVVLVFVLLERESVRDRFIRIAGGTDLHATTLVLNDAGERLSRFFVSQFAVNIGVGVALWLGLAVIGLPHATLFGTLAAVLRFVPYIGVWIAAVCSATLAAAVDPGWTLAIMTVCLFVTIELIAGQLVEPQLYGHTTGLSPLSVVVAAIFWSWLWGPIGLVVSTPLTLCLVVAGRHVKALSLLGVLLGNSHALTLPERFYQRLMSGDSDELVETARSYLKHDSLAAYCDYVLLPAMRLVVYDLASGTVTHDQQMVVRRTLVSVIEAIGGPRRRFLRRRDAISVLDEMTAGRQLRLQREELIGRWQGPLTVPPGSVLICMSMGSMLDDLAAELLVRVLRDKRLDARHLSRDDFGRAAPPDTSPLGVSMVYLVSAAPSEERKGVESVVQEVRRRLAHATLVSMFLPGLSTQADSPDNKPRGVDREATTFEDALQICLKMLEERTKT